MYKLNEIAPVQLGNEKSASRKGKPAAAKLAMCIERENGSEILVYNGVNNYTPQAILEELLPNVS